MSISYFDQNIFSMLFRISLTLGTIVGVLVYLMVWAERRVSAFIQGRLGPNRVGPFGLFQGLADGIKFFFKEELVPKDANTFLFVLAPCAAVLPALLVFATIPYGMRLIEGQVHYAAITNVNTGVLFVISIASLGVFSVILAGWASNSKYPVLGGLRAAAQVISYEIPLGLSVMSVLLLAGTTDLAEIVNLQAQSTWYILLAPLGFLIFLISVFAETNRLPFDMPEGETEIIGFHTEYSSLKFAMFFMAEYTHMIAVSCLTVLLFLGGWEFLPFVSWNDITNWTGIAIYEHWALWFLPTLWFLAKISLFLFLFIWVRWTLPRFRYDQVMRLGWKKLIPLSLFNVFITMMVVVWMS